MRYLGAIFILFASLVGAEPVPSIGMLVWVPQMEESAASWIHFLDTHPSARMVLALSPRFKAIQKDAAVKNRLLELQAQGRLVLAVQIPNAPHLPLIADSGTTPPYRSPDDVLQHLTQARGAFTKAWGVSPAGVVLPYGAVSADVIKIAERSGFSWVVAAAGLPATLSSRRQSSFFGQSGAALWDATPASETLAGLSIRIWDDREMKSSGKAVDAFHRWIQEWEKQGIVCVLPDDSGLPPSQSLEASALQRRTWTQLNWDGWTGAPEKQALWNPLRRTRDAVTAYQNSGQAQMARLDAAMAELMTAQNSNYFLSAGNPQLSEPEREDRQQEFQSALYNVFRLINQPAPEDLFKPLDRSTLSTTQSSMTVVVFDHPSEGVDRMQLTREDSLLRRVDVSASSDTLSWSVTVATSTVQTVELYIDINGLSGVGTAIALPRRALRIHPEDAWEYALRIQKYQATLYRTQSGGTFVVAGTFPVTQNGPRWEGTLPRALIRGSIRRWGYQAVLAAIDETIVAQLSQPRFARFRSGR